MDASAISLSALCVVHCLALPVIVAVLLVGATWLENEWVHRTFVLAALPVSGYAVYSSLAGREGMGFSIAATLGLFLLFAAAFAEPLHDVETPVTIIGALTLALAHLLGWARRHGAPSEPCGRRQVKFSDICPGAARRLRFAITGVL